MPDIDRYPFLSKRKARAANPEAVLDLVRSTWPAAHQHGSTGYERTWICDTPAGRRLVAHSWSPRADMAWFWVRVASSIEDTADADAVWMDPRVRKR